MMKEDEKDSSRYVARMTKTMIEYDSLGEDEEDDTPVRDETHG